MDSAAALPAGSVLNRWVLQIHSRLKQEVKSFSCGGKKFNSSVK